MSDNPDRSMKNIVHNWVHTLKDTCHLGARWIRPRGLSDWVQGSCRDWSHTRKHPRLHEGDPGFQPLIREIISAEIIFLLFIFVSTACFQKFSFICFLILLCLLSLFSASLILILEQSVPLRQFFGLAKDYCIYILNKSVYVYYTLYVNINVKFVWTECGGVFARKMLANSRVSPSSDFSTGTHTCTQAMCLVANKGTVEKKYFLAHTEKILFRFKTLQLYV
jgi:hypothetical protein